MNVHYYSIERLAHYLCGACKRWWSIGDGPEAGPLRCPWCGAEGQVQRIDEQDPGG